MGAVSEIIEKERLSHAVETTEYHKKDFGQYLTPYNIAKFMASFFSKNKREFKYS